MLKDLDDIQFKPARRPEVPEWILAFASSFRNALKAKNEKLQSPVDPIKLSKDYGESNLPVRQFKAEDKNPSALPHKSLVAEQLDIDTVDTSKVVTRVNPQSRDNVDVDETRRMDQNSETRIE